MNKLVLLCLSMALPLAASAATITVNSLADKATAADGQCTLREAIANVNAANDTTSGDCAAGTGAGDTINFNLALKRAQQIKLMLGELAIGQSVTIVGPTTGSLAINGQHASRVFEITAGTTSISDLTIQNGVADSVGGGGVLVNNGASLNLTNCTLRRNRADYPNSGGGIYNAGTVTLTNCALSRNNRFRRGSQLGGGIYNDSGTATLTNSTLSRNSANYGGGIFNLSGSVTLTNSTLSNNDSGNGGGIYNDSGTVTLTNSMLSRNHGSIEGGGIDNGSGRVTLINSTLSRNRGGFFGGGIANGTGIGQAMVTLTNCTLSGNQSHNGQDAGIVNFGTSTASLTNTILVSSPPNWNCGGAITSNGHNLSSDVTCFTPGGTDLVNTDPVLTRLGSYDGPTDTLALCTGVRMPVGSCTGPSPAIDAGDDAVLGPPDSLTTDQRGLPRQAGLHVDIGAYEAQ